MNCTEPTTSTPPTLRTVFRAHATAPVGMDAARAVKRVEEARYDLIVKGILRDELVTVDVGGVEEK